MISDAVSLSDKLGCFVRTLVPEKRTLDAFLVVAPVLGASPNKRSVSVCCSQDDLVAGSANEVRDALGFGAAVMAPVEVADGMVSVLGEPPQRPATKGTVISRPHGTSAGLWGGLEPLDPAVRPRLDLLSGAAASTQRPGEQKRGAQQCERA